MRSVAMTAWVLLFGGVGQVLAGDLEPPAPPDSTMKSLDEIPPTWNQKLDSTNGSDVDPWVGCGSSRFECIWPEGSPIPSPQAVLDKETGLVWERTPGLFSSDWPSAVRYCYVKEVGGRYGWRLPRVEELAALVDESQSNPSLPSGSPFQNIQTGTGMDYWTSSIWAGDGDPGAFFVHFGSDPRSRVYDTRQTFEKLVWCVRGGSGAHVGR